MIVLCCGKHYTFNGLVIHIEKYGLLKNGQTTCCGSILQFWQQEITYLFRKIYQYIEYIATLLLQKRYDVWKNYNITKNISICIDHRLKFFVHDAISVI